MGIPIEAAIKTQELLHLTGAMHKAINDLDNITDKAYSLETVLERCEQIRKDLNSALVQIYGF